MGSSLHYAQGVLLFCFHAMQLSKREYILEYINKAIKKISKLKTPSAQCILANLSFFSIIEQFYTRSQAIAKQIDEADFTIKEFKKLRGLKIEELENNGVEAIPTYGDISIQGDNKYLRDIRDKCLSIWENCLQKNMVNYFWVTLS